MIAWHRLCTHGPDRRMIMRFLFERLWRCYIPAFAALGMNPHAPTVTCTLGNLAASANATITVEPNATGSITATSTVTGTETDPTPANNTDAETTAIGNALGCTITGTAGNDTLNGTNAADVICGLGGNDTINGGNGTDTLYAGTGNDVVDGGNADDTLYGGSGDDIMGGGNGAEWAASPSSRSSPTCLSLPASARGEPLRRQHLPGARRARQARGVPEAAASIYPALDVFAALAGGEVPEPTAMCHRSLADGAAVMASSDLVSAYDRFLTDSWCCGRTCGGAWVTRGDRADPSGAARGDCRGC